MKTKLPILLFLTAWVFGFSQQYVSGKVSTEFETALQNVTILNTRTDVKVVSDPYGNFVIGAKPTDELRFVKSGYERNSLKISKLNFSEPLKIVLTKSPFDIAEIVLRFQAKGKIKKML